MTNPADLEWVAYHQDGFSIYKDRYDDNAPLYAGTEPYNAEPWQPENDKPWKRLALLSQIVREHQYKIIDGQTVDVTTAGVILAVYKALRLENQEKYIQFSVNEMADIAWKIVASTPLR